MKSQRLVALGMFVALLSSARSESIAQRGQRDGAGPGTLEQLVTVSELIVEVEVQSSLPPVMNGNRSIVDAVFQVRRAIKGQAPPSNRLVLAQEPTSPAASWLVKVGERYILFLRAESRPDLFPPVPDGAPRYALVGLNPDLAVVALEQDRIKSTGNSGIQARGGLLGELRAYDGKSVNNLVSDLTAFSSQANRAVMADMASRVAVDAAGNLFILDPGPGQVRKVTPTGAITTIVGTGTPGFSGDGGPAVAAQLKDPKDIAVDAAGNLYIADFSNARVRKVTPTGVITTIPGTEFRSDAGQGVLLFQPNAVAADSAGNLFVGYSARVKKVSSTGVVTDIAGVSPTRAGTLGRGDGGPALAAGLGVVDSVAVDRAGNILFGADGRIRAVTPGGTITTLVGTGSRGLGGDGGPAAAAQITRARCLFVDQDGNVFFCDETRVRKITAKGIITTVAGTGVSGSSGDGGPAIAAQLLPNGIAVDAAGNIFIADYGNHRVRKVTPDGIISTVAK